MATYRLVNDPLGNAAPMVQLVETGAFIPQHPSNRDWADYQQWLAGGGVPLPATYMKQDATNDQLKRDLDRTDGASLRSMRALLAEVARVSQWTQPPLTPDQTFLLTYYQHAAQLRDQIQPPATPTLAEAKLDRIAQLTQQGAAYIQLGFIWGTFTWATKRVFDIGFFTLGGYQVAPLTGDGMVHVWDAARVERLLPPKDAGKLSAGLYQWLYLAQKEYNAAITAVNALTTVAAVKAYVWTTVYGTSNLYNAGS